MSGAREQLAAAWRQIYGAIKFLEVAFLALGMLIAIVIAVIGVFFRYVLERPFTWSEEFLTFLFVWMIFVGASVAVRRREHIHIDVLLSRLPENVARALLRFSALCFALFVALLGWTGWQTVLLQIQTNERSPGMEIPMWTISLALPVGSVLMMLSMLAPPEAVTDPAAEFTE